MGFHPDAATFQARLSELLEARRAMWLWAEPVVIDRAVAFYGNLVDESGTVAMARRHCRLWRNILFDQPSAVSPTRTEMARTADGLGIAASVIDDADDAILEELVDIVMGRYRSSRNTIKTFSLVLMAANSSLSAARAA